MTTTTYSETVSCELTVIRPSGKTEIVTLTDKRKRMHLNMFNKIVADTKKAGRGDVTGYKIISKTVTREMTRDEIELDAYCQSHDATVKAMSY